MLEAYRTTNSGGRAIGCFTPFKRMMATVYFICITSFLSQNFSAHDCCCASFLDSVSWKESIIRLFTEALQTDKMQAFSEIRMHPQANGLPDYMFDRLKS